LDRAIRRIGAAGSGVLVYLGGHEGRGIGLAAKLRAYALQDQGRDTVEANVELGYPVDSRDYAIAAHILRDLGTQRIRLMTNNPAKCTSLTEFGIDVVERVELSVSPNSQNQSYLETKRRKLGHLFAPATQGRLAS
jgi:3,4-dihydroxy 2-butanone 4-phosphate synthase/GTP cyclohydrolase II